MTGLSGADRGTIARARELAGLSDAGIYARYGAGAVSPVTAYARAIGEAQHLLSELAVIAERPAGPSEDTRRLNEIRALLAAFDREHADRQYALEAIERIATQEGET